MNAAVGYWCQIGSGAMTRFIYPMVGHAWRGKNLEDEEINGSFTADHIPIASTHSVFPISGANRLFGSVVENLVDGTEESRECVMEMPCRLTHRSMLGSFLTITQC